MTEENKCIGQIEIRCISCYEVLTELGGLLFSPPNDFAFGESYVTKHHLCINCYKKTIDWLHEVRS